MPTIKIIAATLGGLVAIYCFIPYIKDTLSKKTEPHSYTWFVFSLLQGITMVVMWSSHAGLGLVTVVIGFLLSCFIFLLSLKYGTKNITVFDTICLVGALVSIGVYIFMHDALLSIILVCIIDFVGFIPTFRKSWMEPETETASFFILSALASLFCLIALSEYSWVNVLYPATLMITEPACTFVILARRKLKRADGGTPIAPPVSIIVPTLNEEGYLPLLLKSLRHISTPLDIIVVDGHSEDDTALVVEEYQPLFTGESSLRIITSDKRNISHQRNIGAAIARHDTLIFSDADVIFPSIYEYTIFVTEFKEKGYAVGAPLLVSVEDGFVIQHIYLVMHVFQKIWLFFNRPYFAGASLITTKEVFAKIGGFDTKVLLGEDIDYSMRASKVGTYGLIKIKMPVSSRRFIKYGYKWIFQDYKKLTQFLFKGRITDYDMQYPFGDFGKPAAVKREEK